MNVSDMIKRTDMAKAYDFLDRDPDQNIPKLVDWLEKLDKDGGAARQLSAIKRFARDPESNWFRLARSLWDDVDGEVRKTLFTNLALNLLVNPRLEENRKQYGCNIPRAVLLDPAGVCSLRCIGCGAAEYGLTFDELDGIVEQGKALGAYFYIFSGWEPQARKTDLIALCNKHTDCAFLAFTSGALIDEDFAKEMLRVKNLIPAILVEGKDADFRRGGGIFAGLRSAMEILKGYKLLFGVSCCYTSKNYQMIGSEDYFDALVEWGAKFACFFTYMPVGRAAAPELMVTAEQREYMYRQIRKFRMTKPLFTMDAWNDGEPFNQNRLRSCPLLDSPDWPCEIVDGCGARPADLEDPRDLSVKCAERAADWATTAERLWRESGGG